MQLLEGSACMSGQTLPSPYKDPFPAGRRLADPRIGTCDVRWLALSVMGAGQPSMHFGGRLSLSARLA